MKFRCAVCRGSTTDNSRTAEMVLLCDGKLPNGSACPNETHMYCVDPPMLVVPEGDFFCHACSHYTPADGLKEYFKSFANEVKTLAQTPDAYRDWLIQKQEGRVPLIRYRMGVLQDRVVEDEFVVTSPDLIGRMVHLDYTTTGESYPQELPRSIIGRILMSKSDETFNRTLHYVQFQCNANSHDHGKVEKMDIHSVATSGSKPFSSSYCSSSNRNKKKTSTTTTSINPPVITETYSVWMCLQEHSCLVGGDMFVLDRIGIGTGTNYIAQRLMASGMRILNTIDSRDIETRMNSSHASKRPLDVVDGQYVYPKLSTASVHEMVRDYIYISQKRTFSIIGEGVKKIKMGGFPRYCTAVDFESFSVEKEMIANRWTRKHEIAYALATAELEEQKSIRRVTVVMSQEDIARNGGDISALLPISYETLCAKTNKEIKGKVDLIRTGDIVAARSNRCVETLWHLLSNEVNKRAHSTPISKSMSVRKYNEKFEKFKETSTMLDLVYLRGELGMGVADKATVKPSESYEGSAVLVKEGGKWEDLDLDSDSDVQYSHTSPSKSGEETRTGTDKVKVKEEDSAPGQNGVIEIDLTNADHGQDGYAEEKTDEIETEKTLKSESPMQMESSGADLSNMLRSKLAIAVNTPTQQSHKSDAASDVPMQLRNFPQVVVKAISFRADVQETFYKARRDMMLRDKRAELAVLQTTVKKLEDKKKAAKRAKESKIARHIIAQQICCATIEGNNQAYKEFLDAHCSEYPEYRDDIMAEWGSLLPKEPFAYHLFEERMNDNTILLSDLPTDRWLGMVVKSVGRDQLKRVVAMENGLVVTRKTNGKETKSRPFKLKLVSMQSPQYEAFVDEEGSPMPKQSKAMIEAIALKKAQTEAIKKAQAEAIRKAQLESTKKAKMEAAKKQSKSKQVDEKGAKEASKDLKSSKGKADGIQVVGGKANVSTLDRGEDKQTADSQKAKTTTEKDNPAEVKRTETSRTTTTRGVRKASSSPGGDKDDSSRDSSPRGGKKDDSSPRPAGKEARSSKGDDTESESFVSPRSRSKRTKRIPNDSDSEAELDSDGYLIDNSDDDPPSEHEEIVPTRHYKDANAAATRRSSRVPVDVEPNKLTKGEEMAAAKLAARAERKRKAAKETADAEAEAAKEALAESKGAMRKKAAASKADNEVIILEGEGSKAEAAESKDSKDSNVKASATTKGKDEKEIKKRKGAKPIPPAVRAADLAQRGFIQPVKTSMSATAPKMAPISSVSLPPNKAKSSNARDGMDLDDDSDDGKGKGKAKVTNPPVTMATTAADRSPARIKKRSAPTADDDGEESETTQYHQDKYEKARILGSATAGGGLFRKDDSLLGGKRGIFDGKRPPAKKAAVSVASNQSRSEKSRAKPSVRFNLHPKMQPSTSGITGSILSQKRDSSSSRDRYEDQPIHYPDSSSSRSRFDELMRHPSSSSSSNQAMTASRRPTLSDSSSSRDSKRKSADAFDVDTPPEDVTNDNGNHHDDDNNDDSDDSIDFLPTDADSSTFEKKPRVPVPEPVRSASGVQGQMPQVAQVVHDLSQQPPGATAIPGGGLLHSAPPGVNPVHWQSVASRIQQEVGQTGSVTFFMIPNNPPPVPVPKLTKAQQKEEKSKKLADYRDNYLEEILKAANEKKEIEEEKKRERSRSNKRRAHDDRRYESREPYNRYGGGRDDNTTSRDAYRDRKSRFQDTPYNDYDDRPAPPVERKSRFEAPHRFENDRNDRPPPPPRRRDEKPPAPRYRANPNASRRAEESRGNSNDFHNRLGNSGSSSRDRNNSNPRGSDKEDEDDDDEFDIIIDRKGQRK